MAKTMIDEEGEAIVIQKLVATAGAVPWRPGVNTVTTVKATGVFFPNQGIRNPHTRQRRRKSDVSEASLMGYIPAVYLTSLGYRLDDTDTIVRSDGTFWKVVSVDDMAPVSTLPIYYEVRLTA